MKHIVDEDVCLHYGIGEGEYPDDMELLDEGVRRNAEIKIGDRVEIVMVHLGSTNLIGCLGEVMSLDEETNRWEVKVGRRRRWYPSDYLKVSNDMKDVFVTINYGSCDILKHERTYTSSFICADKDIDSKVRSEKRKLKSIFGVGVRCKYTVDVK